MLVKWNFNRVFPLNGLWFCVGSFLVLGNVLCLFKKFRVVNDIRKVYVWYCESYDCDYCDCLDHRFVELSVFVIAIVILSTLIHDSFLESFWLSFIFWRLIRTSFFSACHILVFIALEIIYRLLEQCYHLWIVQVVYHFGVHGCKHGFNRHLTAWFLFFFIRSHSPRLSHSLFHSWHSVSKWVIYCDCTFFWCKGKIYSSSLL